MPIVISDGLQGFELAEHILGLAQEAQRLDERRRDINRLLGRFTGSIVLPEGLSFVVTTTGYSHIAYEAETVPNQAKPRWKSVEFNGWLSQPDLLGTVGSDETPQGLETWFKGSTFKKTTDGLFVISRQGNRSVECNTRTDLHLFDDKYHREHLDTI